MSSWPCCSHQRSRASWAAPEVRVRAAGSRRAPGPPARARAPRALLGPPLRAAAPRRLRRRVDADLRARRRWLVAARAVTPMTACHDAAGHRRLRVRRQPGHGPGQRVLRQVQFTMQTWRASAARATRPRRSRPSRTPRRRALRARGRHALALCARYLEMDLRAQFPVLDRIAYLNAGTDGPMPRAASDAGAPGDRRAGRGRPHAGPLRAPPRADRPAARALRGAAERRRRTRSR